MVNNNFVIIVAVYNAVYNGVNHIENCLNSIVGQSYKNYEVVVIDDCSTDGTWETIEKYPFHKIRNGIRNHHGFLNQLRAMRYLSMDDNDIYVILDGDDYLIDNYVLGYVNGMYQDDTWLTYGKFNSMSGTWKDFGKPLNNVKIYRRSQLWVTSHLKTFRKHLFDRIKDTDLRDEDGEYFKVIGDTSIMYPMIEMAGIKRIKCAERVLYIYNDLHPAGEFADKYLAEDKLIKNKPLYGLVK